MGLLVCVALLAILAGFLGVASYRAARWCLGRGWRGGCTAVLILLGFGVAYGLLRTTGLLQFPGDSTMSYDFFDASYRDDGARFLCICGPFLFGTGAAFLRGRGDPAESVTGKGAETR